MTTPILLDLPTPTPRPADAAHDHILTQLDPSRVRRIHVLGVAGTGMGSFAGLLKDAGFVVTGSDENVYPPMSDMLKAWGIAAMSPYQEANLEAAQPDLVVVGNVIRRVNPEAVAMRARSLPHVSFPLALGALFLAQRHSVVVAGTHVTARAPKGFSAEVGAAVAVGIDVAAASFFTAEGRTAVHRVQPSSSPNGGGIG